MNYDELYYTYTANMMYIRIGLRSRDANSFMGCIGIQEEIITNNNGETTTSWWFEIDFPILSLILGMVR